MNVELITKNDLDNLRDSLLKELRAIMGSAPAAKKWLKSSEVREILGCSPGTLQNLRVNGTLEYTKIGGTIYYCAESVNSVFENNRRNVA
ncbi:MAG: helix-turn-helix domain-containing protein [Bacteroidales bacterium]|nr:helix-turn-helix domain-containing protein [Bacteroidales bacterium]